MSHYKHDTNQKRLRAAELERKTLFALGVLGVLATSQAAKWAANDSKSAFVIQRRVMKRLEKNGLVMHKKDRLGRHMYYLTKPGALLLRKIEPEGKWHHGHDIGHISPDVQSRIFEKALEERRQGHEVYGPTGMKAYGINRIPKADLLIMTSAENLAVRVSRRGDNRWELCNHD